MNKVNTFAENSRVISLIPITISSIMNIKNDGEYLNNSIM